jgi:hypothetical protein
MLFDFDGSSMRAATAASNYASEIIENMKQTWVRSSFSTASDKFLMFSCVGW